MTTTNPATELRGLTPLNVRALRETQEAHGLTVVLGKTTAHFDAAPAEVVTRLNAAMAMLPAKGHPRASLHAVMRKAEKAVIVKAPHHAPAKAEKAAKPANGKAHSAANRAELEALIERAAKGAGTMTIVAAIPGCAANVKGITDKVRRMPRVKGWKALGVSVVEATDSAVTMEVTCEGTSATAWPTREAPAKKAPAKKATKAPAKAAAKSTGRTTRKAAK